LKDLEEQCGSLMDLFLTLYCPDSFRDFLLSANVEKDIRQWEDILIEYMSGWDQLVRIHLFPMLDLLMVLFTDLQGFSRR
jgi:hypothetical protein